MQCAGQSSGIYSAQADVVRLRREVGGWLVSNTIKPISFSSYNAADWSMLPTSLSWMALLYARRYVREHLGLDSHTKVDVQGKLSQNGYNKQPNV